MSSYSDSTPPQSQGGDSGKDKYECDPPPQTPPPSECPNPCENPPDYGPPPIRTDCCTHHRCCPEDEAHCCTWYEVDDPCVRAASADCGKDWTRIDCKCSSTNEKCDCEEWDCGCYPPGTCVPCKPCEGLIPDPTQPTGGCDDPGGGECSSDNLRRQLDALNQCISSQQGAKAKLDADIKARTERATALNDLIKAFDDITKKYKEQRYKLICKEDCLKGFHRDVTTQFKKYPKAYLDDLMKAINAELCRDELAKCCQKNLEGKFTKVTKLLWEQQEAEREMKKADQAFAIIKDLPKWIEDRFKELEALTDEIGKALNDTDPEKQKWAFYLFYWKFAPGLCRCFPYPFCCEPKEETQPEGQTEAPQKQDQKNGGGKKNGEEPPPHLGCKPGDWHPRAIDDERLKALICCAWEYARQRKQDYQDATARVTDATNNLEFIKKKVEGDPKTLDQRLKSGLEKVKQPTPASA